MKVYFDTNVLVAAVIENHPHHVPSESALLRAHRGEIEGCISAHTLAEFYAVLTRLPLKPPVYPSEAWQILETSVLPHFEVECLSAKAHRDTLRDCAAAGWTGGRVYDALHLMAARRAQCDQIYTFNVRHFREIGPDLSGKIRTP